MLPVIKNGAAIAKSDSANLPKVSRAIYVGGGGDVKVDLAGVGSAIVFKAVPAGTLLPIQATKVYSTLTTATDMVLLY